MRHHDRELRQVLDNYADPLAACIDDTEGPARLVMEGGEGDVDISGPNSKLSGPTIGVSHTGAVIPRSALVVACLERVF